MPANPQELVENFSGKYGSAELDSYENSLKTYRDLKGVIDTAFDEGKLEGKLEGKVEMARALKASGVATEIIAGASGLSAREIDQL
ncbi:MAG: hypothetical protein ACRYFX_05490 [Janthinobacterium lividum]